MSDPITTTALSNNKEFTTELWTALAAFSALHLTLLHTNFYLCTIDKLQNWYNSSVSKKHRWLGNDWALFLWIFSFLYAVGPVVLMMTYITDYAIDANGGVLEYVIEPGITSTEALYYKLGMAFHLAGIGCLALSPSFMRWSQSITVGNIFMIIGWSLTVTTGVLWCLIDIVPGILYCVFPFISAMLVINTVLYTKLNGSY